MTPLNDRQLLPQQLGALLKLQQYLMVRAWQKQHSLSRWSSLLSHGFSAIFSVILAVGVGFLIALPGMDTLQTAPDLLLRWLWSFAFGILGFMWTLSPLLFLMKNENLSLDLRKLLPYPIGVTTLHRYHCLLAFFEPWSLFFYPLGLAVLWSSAYWPDANLISRLGLIPLLALWAMVHTLGNRLLQDMMLRLFQSRYWKELLSLILLFVVIFASFAPAFVAEQLTQEKIISPPAHLSPDMLLYSLPFWRVLETGLNALLYFSPPGFFVQGLWALYEHQYLVWAQQLVSLSLWSFLIYLGSWKLLQGLLQEPETLIMGQRKQRNKLQFHLPLPAVIQAVALKDLHTYFRSLLGKLAFFLTPLMVILLRGAGLGVQPGGPSLSYLLSIIGYLFLTSVYLYINVFGPEGEGFKHYILSGADPRAIFLGKNLALGLFACAQFSLISGIFLCLYPHSSALFQTGWLSFLSLLFGVLSLGNLLSIRTPGPMNLNKSHYKQNSGTPILLSFQVLMVLSGIISLPLFLHTWLGTPLLLLNATLCLLMGFGWYTLLHYAARLFPQEAPFILEAITAKEAS